MISSNCDIREFISNLENKDFFEMIYLLDQEATEAERQLFNPKSKLSEKQILSFIKTCGLAPTKAKSIKRLSEILRDRHGGKVFPELEGRRKRQYSLQAGQVSAEDVRQRTHHRVDA